ncbi:MAG: HlyC/CorC family transporter [Anaerolineae bacterium]|nr:HlyC/CorC family transporter [Anaerolineae bacterium]
MTIMLWGLIGLIVLFIISAYSSITQTALSAVRRQSLREEAEQGNKRAQSALAIAEDSLRVINTFKIVNLVTLFLTASLFALIFVPPVGEWIAELVSIKTTAANVIVYLILVPAAALLVFAFTEVLPELVALHDPVRWAMLMAPIARLTVTIFYPLVRLMLAFRRTISVPLGSDPDSTAIVTEEEIMTLVDAGEEEGSIEQEEKEMIYSIFQLDETLAREIMVPRIDVVALEINTPLEEARKVIIDAGHSRIPVFEESLDHIKGLLYAKDLLEVWHEGKQSVDLSSLLRTALFVPESKRVSDLLHELQNQKVHLAIVIDEYGGTAGLVTIEDIVEEIVGEILDEYDEDEEAAFEKLADDEYLFDARIDLDDFNRLLNTELSDELGDTLGGFIYAQLGKVPEPGETVETEHLEIEVVSVIDRRIRKVHVRQLAREEALPTEPQESDTQNHVSKNDNGH